MGQTRREKRKQKKDNLAFFTHEKKHKFINLRKVQISFKTVLLLL